MTHRTSIEFHFRPSNVPEKRKTGSIYVRVIRERKVSSVTLPWHIYPEEWDDNKRILIYPENDPLRALELRQIEEDMKNLRHTLIETTRRLELERISFNAFDILADLRKNKGNTRLARYVDQLCLDMAKNGKQRAARSYRSTLNRFLAFTGNRETELQCLKDANLLKKFEQFLFNEKKSKNTVSFYMRTLRAVYTKALNDRLIVRAVIDPFEKVYTEVDLRHTPRVVLTREELEKLFNWDGDVTPFISEKEKDKNKAKKSASSHEKDFRDALQYFIFSLLGEGISFSDMAHLKKTDIDIIPGMLIYRRNKTGWPHKVTILPKMREIIQYFEEETKDSPYVFPIIRNPGARERIQYFSALRVHNTRLQEVGKLCGISKIISTQMAKRTWAYLAYQDNLPVILISEILGIKSDEATMTYLDSLIA